LGAESGARIFWQHGARFGMLVLMVGSTMVGLWILAQPIAETGAG